MLYIQNFMYSSHLKKCKYINVGPCPESPFVSRDYKGWRVFTDSLNGAKWSKKLQSEWKTEKSCRTQCGIEEASIFFDVFYNIWNLWNMFSQLMGKTDSHWQYVLFYSRDAWRTGDLAVTAAKRKPSLCSAPASRGRKNPRHIAHWTEMSVRGQNAEDLRCHKVGQNPNTHDGCICIAPCKEPVLYGIHKLKWSYNA